MGTGAHADGIGVQNKMSRQNVRQIMPRPLAICMGGFPYKRIIAENVVQYGKAEFSSIVLTSF